MELSRTSKEIIEQLKQFSLDAALLESKTPELLRSHPMQWAGTYKGEIQLASTQKELIALFGDASPRTPMKFLNPNPKTLILFSCRPVY